jgi:hypothetical protein
LEEHLGRLYFEMQNAGSDASRRAYFDLVQMYQSELLKTTNWMIGRPGCLKKLLVAELRRGRRISIVTFNHDLLAENALALLPAHRHAGSWCLRHAYEIGDLDQVAASGGRFDADCPGRTAPHVKVLKLHGSVNWVFRTRDPYPPRNFGQASKRKLFLWTNTTLPESPGIRLHTRGRGRDWYVWPLIVPPIYEKHGLIRHELERVWKEASEEVGNADRILFWGYSFPRADLHARYFFESAANLNDAIRRPVLINPDPGAEVELWKVLRPRSVRHYRHIGEHLTLEYV